MNRKNLFAALGCGLLVMSMLGCGASNKLQSITLTASLINGVAPSSQTGFTTLQGDGSTIQLQAMANYSGSGTKDITSRVTYAVVVDPNYTQNAYGGTLLPPCYGPCPNGGTQGTVEISTTGLVTAVAPATCTWVDIAPTGSPASWFFVGDYVVTASYQGVTSQPMYIPVASQAGDQYYPPLINGDPDTNPANENNPTGQCGPGAS